MSHPNVNVRNQKGQAGGVYITGAGTTAGTFDAIQALTAAVLNLASPNITGAALNAVPIPAGAIIYGTFTSVTWVSGSVIAYNKV